MKKKWLSSYKRVLFSLEEEIQPRETIGRTRRTLFWRKKDECKKTNAVLLNIGGIKIYQIFRQIRAVLKRAWGLGISRCRPKCINALLQDGRILGCKV